MLLKGCLRYLYYSIHKLQKWSLKNFYKNIVSDFENIWKEEWLTFKKEQTKIATNNTSVKFLVLSMQ